MTKWQMEIFQEAINRFNRCRYYPGQIFTGQGNHSGASGEIHIYTGASSGLPDISDVLLTED